MGDTVDDLVKQLRELVQPAPPPKRGAKLAGLVLALLLAAFGYAVWKVPTVPGPEYARPE